MKTIVLIERGKDGLYWLRTSGLQNMIMGSGSSLQEAKEDFEICLQDMKESYTECGEALPKELVNLSFEYKYDTASALTAFSFINLAALAREVGINASLLRQYKKGQYISQAQAKKIQEGIHRLGERMMTFNLI